MKNRDVDYIYIYTHQQLGTLEPKLGDFDDIREFTFTIQRPAHCDVRLASLT